MDCILNDIEVRVLGSLIEKELTTPEYYPLSLNALTNACNQKSNRDPAMSLSEEEVVRALDSLRFKQLAVLSADGGRVPKYRHLMAEKSGLSVFTISTFENGSSTGVTLASFIKLLRAIDSLDEIEKLFFEAVMVVLLILERFGLETVRVWPSMENWSGKKELFGEFYNISKRGR
jgi:uncharacterized protein YceH (UPF0502 family)